VADLAGGGAVAVGHAGLGGRFIFVTNADDTITVAGIGGESFVSVPAAVDGKPVTVIGDGAFYCGSLSGISLPGTLTNIEWNAFMLCTNLVELTLPNGVCNVADSAFEGCGSLTRVAMGAGVENIGDSAFADCTNLLDAPIGAGVERSV
jgi:hypothetical protein